MSSASRRCWASKVAAKAEIPAKTTKAAAKKTKKKEEPAGISARVGGRIERKARSRKLTVIYDHQDVREYAIPAAARLRITEGQEVQAGERITEGSVNPQDMLRILGLDAVHRYLVTEVQQVYRAQGVNINDRHIEVIVRQMLRRVRIESPGDSDLLAGELVDRFHYEEINTKLVADHQEPAAAQPVLLGVTKASLSQESWLAAASFQETTRVLTEAAVSGAVDSLHGLKENVIIGKLIPARAEIELPPLPEPSITSAEGAAALLGEDGMEGMSEELMRELGLTLRSAEEEEKAVGAGAPAGGIDLSAGYVAEPDED